MIYIKFIKISIIVFLIIVAIFSIILQLHYYGQLFVTEHPSRGGFAVNNALPFFSIFVLMAMVIYAIIKTSFKKKYVHLVNTFILLIFLYNTMVMVIFMSSSVRFHIRSMEPGVNVGGYFDSIYFSILFIMSIVIIITTIIQGRWLFNNKKKQN